MTQDILVLIRGGGDLATGVAHRLYQAGFKVAITELARPLVVRRAVSLAEAVYQGEITVENITGLKVDNYDAAIKVISEGYIPVIIDPELKVLDKVKPNVLVDATMQKEPTGVKKELADIVIGLGPGFNADENVDAVIETARGHYLGKVYYQGEAIPNTGIPGSVGGYTLERLLRAPKEGVFEAKVSIGDQVESGNIIGRVYETPVVSEIDGIVRGLLKSGLFVKQGLKIGDIDPRAAYDHCFTISDKARSIGGGVLEGIMHYLKK